MKSEGKKEHKTCLYEPSSTSPTLGVDPFKMQK